MGTASFFVIAKKMFDWIDYRRSQSQKRYSGQRVGMVKQKWNRLAPEYKR
ncbi:hypothetical protein [Epilithonimonas xixisoli]|nr:hypothetical protein [Epilithonimonas xixisoli]